MSRDATWLVLTGLVVFVLLAYAVLLRMSADPTVPTSDPVPATTCLRVEPL